ncbi:MAG: HAD-IA family hydrolase [Patescibacteria group bacterium]
MKKVVIFDLNGVFVLSPKLSERYEKEFGVSANEFLPALKAVMAVIRQPQAPDAYDVWKPYLDKWGLNLSREQFLEFWFSAEGGNEEMVALARELKRKGFKFFILSNNFRERAEYYDQNFPFFTELFEKIYYSWQTGFVKPDCRAFELVLVENHLKPEETIFFDDSEKNIEVAKSLGIKAYIFGGAAEVKTKVIAE